MLLIDLIKKSYSSLIANPTMTLLLVLFLIVSNFLASCIVTVKMKEIAIIIALCFFVFIAAFISGWFSVIRESFDIEKIKEKNFYSIFFEGIGKNIISSLLGIIIYFTLMLIVLFITREFAHHFFGSLDFLFKDISNLAQDNKNTMEYLKSLTVDQKYIIYTWQFSFFSAMALFQFIFLFYFPSIICQNKNIFLKPLYAVYDTLKTVFKNFFSVLTLYIFIQVLHFFLAYLNVRFTSNAFIGVILLFIYIYFASFVIMLIFNYYEAKNPGTDGCNCVKQDENCD